MRSPIEHPQRRKAKAALWLAVPLVLALAACGGTSGTSATSSTTAGGASPAAAPDTIRIAYQEVPNGDLIVKNKGWLEEAFPDSTIEWKKFDSGGDVNEAFAAGSVDIGLVGSSPVSRGLSSGIPYQVPWIYDVIGAAEALVVRSSEVTTLQDLVGKRVATPFASTAHYSLLAALTDAGVDPTQVDIIDAAPDEIFAAWTRGDIDGAYVWNPNLARLEADGGTVLIDSAQLAATGKTTYDLAVVSDGFAEAYPQAVTTWTAQQNRAVELIKNDPTAAANAVAAELGITEQEAADQLDDLIFLTATEQVGSDYLGGGLATNLIAAAAFNKELGKIPAVEPDSVYQAAVVATFAKEVAGP